MRLVEEWSGVTARLRPGRAGEYHPGRMTGRLVFRRYLLVVAIATSSTATARAHAQGSCSDVAVEAQARRDARELLESRALLRRCAARECPALIQRDCSRWLEDVEKSLPTVVLAAKDATGQLLVDVKVTADGTPIADQLDGRAVPMNPGVHTFHFERSDGVSAERRLPVREGEKNQEVLAVFESPAPVQAKSPTQLASVEPAELSRPPNVWRSVGWVAGGVGVLGIGLGATFGFIAVSDKNAAACDAAGACNGQELSSARSHATIANVAFITGGILLAGGAALVLFAPRDHSRPSPRVTARLSGIALEGAW